MEDKDYKYIFKEFINLTDDGFVVVDKNNRITDINDKYCEFLKTSSSEAVGKPVTEVIQASKLPELMQTGAKETGMVIKIGEDTGFTEDALVLVNRAGIRGEDGEMIGAIAQVRFRL